MIELIILPAVKSQWPITLASCLCCLLVVGSASCSGNEHLVEEDPDKPEQWTLPRFLREASGLAHDGDGQLLAHNDEKANIYRISITDKSAVKLASVGKPPLRGDFEGIAAADGRVYLSSSSGQVLVISDIDKNLEKQVVSAEVINTGLGKKCELEGLHHHQGRLLLPCKNAHLPAYRDRLVVFYYDLSDGSTGELISINQASVPGLKKLRLTAVDQAGNDLYLVSANRLLVIDVTTSAVRTFKLAKKYHEQIEAIAVMPDGSIFLAEDNSKGLARLTRYAGLDELEQKF